jgi:hypothetical protein
VARFQHATIASKVQQKEQKFIPGVSVRLGNFPFPAL